MNWFEQLFHSITQKYIINYSFWRQIQIARPPECISILYFVFWLVIISRMQYYLFWSENHGHQLAHILCQYLFSTFSSLSVFPQAHSHQPTRILNPSLSPAFSALSNHRGLNHQVPTSSRLPSEGRCSNLRSITTKYDSTDRQAKSIFALYSLSRVNGDILTLTRALTQTGIQDKLLLPIYHHQILLSTVSFNSA